MAEITKDRREVLSAKTLFGVITPLVTPWIRNDSFPPVHNEEDTRSLVEHLIDYSNILFASGNAGEGIMIDPENYKSLISTVVDQRNKNKNNYVPVVAGVLKSDPEEIKKFVKIAEKSGADGLVIAPILGGKPITSVVTAIENSSLPIILYTNAEMHDNENLPIDTIKYLLGRYGERIVGIKVTSKDYEYFKRVLELKSPTFSVLQGHTAFGPESLSLGADGIVPIEANIESKLFRIVYDVIKRSPDKTNLIKTQVDFILDELKSKKEADNIKTIPLIKRTLLAKGVINSSRMYSL